jgi:hypothetical protein
MTAVAMIINTVTAIDTMAPGIKANSPPSVIELTTYESICTNKNVQKKVQKYFIVFTSNPILHLLSYYHTLSNLKTEN